MKVTLDAQTGGSLIVVGAFAASEASARLLDGNPGSAFAWYLHLEVFRPFELARGEITPLSLLFGPDALAVDLALMAAILLVAIARFRLGIAFCANISFGIAAALAHSWIWGASAPKTASLAAIALPRSPDGLLVGVMLAASFAAFLTSHVSFLKAIRLSRTAGEPFMARRPEAD